MKVQEATFASLPPPAALTPEAFAELLRRAEIDGEVSSYLESITVQLTLPGTKTVVRWHRIAHNSQNQPDVGKLVAKLMKLLIDFACTRSEIEAATRRLAETRSSEGFSGLQEKARRLFTRAKRAGEVGDLLLFYFAERLLGYPQILCKMPLKTNPEVHAHGADGVHSSIHPESGHLRLHWGEAKLMATFDGALNDCCFSLQEMLSAPSGAKKSKDRDVELLRDYVDLENPAIEEAIKQYLNPDEAISNKIEFCGLALICFNCADYDAFCQEMAKPEPDAIKVRTAEWCERIKAVLEKHELIGMTVDLLCLPCSSVEDIRQEFRRVLGA